MIISFKQKKFYVFDLIALILTMVMIVYVVILFVNPTTEVLKKNDAGRRSDLAVLGEALKEYTSASGTGYLTNISDCVDGWTHIGKGEGQFDLEALIGEKVNNEEGFLHDPKKNPADTGYDICKTIDGNTVELNAPNSDLRDNISFGININVAPSE